MARIAKPIPPLPQIFVDKVTALYLKGVSIDNTAYELGTTPLQCRRALTQAGTPLRSRGESTKASKPLRGVCRQSTSHRDTA